MSIFQTFFAFAVLLCFSHYEAASIHGKILKSIYRVKRDTQIVSRDTCTFDSSLVDAYTERLMSKCSVASISKSSNVPFHIRSTTPYRVCKVPETYVEGSPKQAVRLCNEGCLLLDPHSTYMAPLTTLVKVWTAGDVTHPRGERWIRVVVGYSCVFR